jgi:GNAT superfamily N-acetyltransferase
MTSLAELSRLARHTMRTRVGRYRDSDSLVVNELLQHVRLTYVAEQASTDSSDSTQVQLQLDHGRRLMWIRDLRVCSAFRNRGVGRQLAGAAEHLARCVGVRRINLLPLGDAREFWHKLGYTPHPRMSRVLTKTFGSPQRRREETS